MTRVYTTGDASKPLRSAEVSEDLVDEIIQAHNNANIDSFSVILERELDPLKQTHAALKIRGSDSSVSIGYVSQDGWNPIATYNRNNKKWYTKIMEKDYYFDASLKYIDLSHIHDYEKQEEFVKNEFVKNDGLKWIKEKESNGF